MHLTRQIARSAVRMAFRNSRPCSALNAQIPRASWRAQTSMLKPVKHAACFSTSTPRLEANELLAAKLVQEIAYETSAEIDEAHEGQIKDYLSGSDFQLEDVEGSQEVHLVRTYNDEKIKVTFSTAGLSNADDAEADAAMYDEGGPEGGPGKGRQGSEDDGESEDFGDEGSVIVAVDVQVIRPDKGAILLETELDANGNFEIKHVAYYPTAEMAEGKTPEAQLSQRNLYSGPPFVELDEDLQTLFDDFLRERGINEGLAVFIPNYIEQKEQREYVKWLENVKKFVE